MTSWLLTLLRAWRDPKDAEEVVRVPCVICLRWYSFRLDQQFEHPGKGGRRHLHYGMFCSEECLVEYCRIVVRAAKGSQLVASFRMVFKEEDGVLLPVAMAKGCKTNSRRKHVAERC